MTVVVVIFCGGSGTGGCGCMVVVVEMLPLLLVVVVLLVTPLLVSQVICRDVSIRRRSPSYERFLEGRSITLHATRRTPHGALRLVQANLSGW